ncbi:MAG: ATP-binding protein [Desulfonatronovibrionaceae bacterium]
MQIAVASGKGGTGKTTITVNLATYLIEQGENVQLVDCDVEEPNSHFFLDLKYDPEEKQYVQVPEIDMDKCLGQSCQKCIRECRFKALIWMVDQVMVFPELCHSCGLCKLVCPADAVGDSHREIGAMRRVKKDNLHIYGGLLRIGEAMAPPLIARVKEAARAEPKGTTILDCPPGTTCPVIESLEGADYVILVTEPTPFGLYDLQLAVQLMQKLHYPFGVVVNRQGMGGEEELDKYLRENDIEVLGRLPHTKEAAEAYSRGELLVDVFPEFREIYADIWQRIENKVSAEVSA